MKVISRQELIEAIQATARALKTDRLRREEFRRRTGLWDHHILAHFNGWSEACAAAGIKSCVERIGRTGISGVGEACATAGIKSCAGPPAPRSFSREDVLKDLGRVIADVGPNLPRGVYDDKGKYCSQTVVRKFGTWQKALSEAGGKPGLGYKAPVDLVQLAGEFLKAVIQSGRIPSIGRLVAFTGRADATLGRKFGGYPRFKLQAIDQIFTSGRPLSVEVRQLLEKERARCAAKVHAKPPSHPRKRGAQSKAAQPEKGGDSPLASLIDKLKRDDEHLDIEAKEAFFSNTRDTRASPGVPQPNSDSALEGLLKTVVAFANTIGGDLIIGLKDKTWEEVGIDETDILLCRDWDGFKRRFTRFVSDRVGGIAPAPEVCKDVSTGRTVAIIRVSQLPRSCFRNRDLAYLKNGIQSYIRTNGDSIPLAPSDRSRHCDAMLARKGS